MDWIEGLNASIQHIENCLDENLDFEELGRIAGCSSYHYQRMFAYMAGVPLSEYVRRRRMTKAAFDLQNGEKIIDVAYKYGYASPTSFNRAFRMIHGITPSQAKGEGVMVKAFQPLSFKITIQGIEELKFKIEKKAAMRIVGISQPLEKKMEKNNVMVPQMWEQAQMDGTIMQLVSIMNEEPYGVLGVSSCTTGEEEWKYIIAVASNTPIEGTNFVEYTIPAATWAIFSGSGIGISIQELQRKVFLEWLPTSGYEYADVADIEVYINPDPEDTKYEVWLPVVKK